MHALNHQRYRAAPQPVAIGAGSPNENRASRFDVAVRRVGFALLTTLAFALLYSGLDASEWNGIDDDDDDAPGLSRFFTRLYLSATIMSSVGFGDLPPATTLARVAILSQQIVLIAELTVLLSYG